MLPQKQEKTPKEPKTIRSTKERKLLLTLSKESNSFKKVDMVAQQKYYH